MPQESAALTVSVARAAQAVPVARAVAAVRQARGPHQRPRVPWRFRHRRHGRRARLALGAVGPAGVGGRTEAASARLYTDTPFGPYNSARSGPARGVKQQQLRTGARHGNPRGW